MTRPQKILFALVLLLGLAGGLVEHRVIVRQRAELESRRSQISRLENAIRVARHELVQLQRELTGIEHEITTTRADLAVAEAGSTIKLWAHRITLLKRLLEEMPEQAIPEFRLLTPLDWVQVARALELDTAGNIRSALGGLRTLARQKFGEKLREALKRFTADSGGELPGDILQLTPYLSPPADTEMLARYAMIRSGKVGAAEEYVIKENSVANYILWVATDTAHFGAHPEWKIPAGESDEDRWERERAAMAAFAAGDPEHAEEIKNLHELYSPHAKKFLQDLLMPLFDEWQDADMQTAVDRFGAAQAGKTPTNLAQLLPHLKNADKLAQGVRPFIAYYEYLRDHSYQTPKDPAQLARYLNGPFDPAAALRSMKIQIENGRFSGLKWAPE